MNELVKALKNFIVRDIIYIIGGASVILSFLYFFNRIDIIGKDTSTFTYLFIAGIAYVIGYCIQDTASWIRIVTTASYFEPWRILRWLYHRLLHRGWQDIFPDIQDGEQRREEVFKRLDDTELRIQEQAKAFPDHSANRERITYLMLIGTTIGPCWLVSGLIIIIRVFVNGNCTFTFDITLAMSVLIISALLIILGWIKGLQLMKNTEELYNFYRNRKFQEYDP